MKVNFQAGHNTKMNNRAILDHKIGDGLIISPMDLDSEYVEKELDINLKRESFLDPQYYMLSENKRNIGTYPFFPGNIKNKFSTKDLETENNNLAKLCVDYQILNEFKYIVIPTKYYRIIPPQYYDELELFFVNPFLDYIKSISNDKSILLNVIVKEQMLSNQSEMDDLLNWITGIKGIEGVYLIFENNSNQRQINDRNFLVNALNFIRILKKNNLEVHLGYTGIEAFVYSVAMPDSIAMGVFGNLRSFGIERFELSPSNGGGPIPAKLYSGKLFQFIDYGMVQNILGTVPDSTTYFDNSKFNPLNKTEPDYDWQYKLIDPAFHYFETFYNQVIELPDDQEHRIDYLKMNFRKAISLYKELDQYVPLDNKNSGDHLSTWYSVISTFLK
jgi:hypothetical protein